MTTLSTTQYRCKNNRRRLAVRDSAHLNGIDFLEVVSLNQLTLEVHFLKDLPIGAAALVGNNIAIEGGVRVVGITVVTAVTNGRVLQITVDRAGDFSNYTFRLRSSPTDEAPPAGFDLQLAAVEFNFKANCPSNFDCQTESNCPPEVFPTPRINYLAKDYSSFRQQMMDRLSLLMPEWKDRNVADLQLTLVELLAYAGDHLSYYQDAVATESYLFTARKRTSIRRHARLLDYHLHNGNNARCWVHIAPIAGGALDGANFPSGTPLLSQNGMAQTSLPASEFTNELRNPELVVFETMHELLIRSTQNEITFYTWEDTNCCLAVGSTKATLRGDALLGLTLKGGDVLLLEEVRSPITGSRIEADPARRHLVRIISAIPTIDSLNGTPIVNISWREEDALPFPLYISAEVEDQVIENISVVRGNMVLADQGYTVAGEQLIPAIKEQESSYQPRLIHRNITVREEVSNTALSGAAANDLLRQNVRKAVPIISLTDSDETWNPQRDLLQSDQFANEFVPEIDTDGTVQLRFGDDLLGKQPGIGFAPTATYRVGNGPTGNVGAEAIGRIINDLGGIAVVRNPLPAVGGRAPESTEEVRQFAPEAFRTQERAVTEADYALKARLHPAVQDAVAQFRWTGSWHTVFLTIDRQGGLPITTEFTAEITDFLEQFRMAGYDLEIRPPVFVPLDIELLVCVDQGYFRDQIEKQLRVVFSRYLTTDGQLGFFHPDNFKFGQSLYLSNIYELAMRIDGVASVEVQRFKRWAKPAAGERAVGYLTTAFNEIIRLDNDPNFPENGKITFQTYGGI